MNYGENMHSSITHSFNKKKFLKNLLKSSCIKTKTIHESAHKFLTWHKLSSAESRYRKTRSMTPETSKYPNKEHIGVVISHRFTKDFHIHQHILYTPLSPGASTNNKKQGISRTAECQGCKNPNWPTLSQEIVTELTLLDHLLHNWVLSAQGACTHSHWE